VLCFFLLAGLTFLRGQKEMRWAVSATVGPSIPLGKFADKNIYDEQAAFALPGIALNLSADYQISKLFRLELLLAGKTNPVDTKAMTSKMQQAAPGVAFEAESDDWKTGWILAGLSFLAPLERNGRFFFIAKVLGGVMKTSIPKITIASVGYVDSLGGIGTSSFSQSAVPLEWAFAWTTGAGLKYNLTRHFFLQAEADFSSSSPRATSNPLVLPGGSNFYSITGNPLGSGIPSVSTGSPKHYSQPIATVNFLVGAGINF